MAVYRSTLPNFYSDKGGSYVSVGAIVPTLVGVNTDKDTPVFTQDPEYDYRGYLYCDGAEYKIKDYPSLYQKVGNTYLKSTDLQRNSLTFAYLVHQEQFIDLSLMVETFILRFMENKKLILMEQYIMTE